ncbi:MAG TPA: tetratricopeptide repeat protein [Pyrinomonadaceae bacterium]|nr:tetratricopeptide repeat protein [Pyrinomonadaceae bacterium]
MLSSTFTPGTMIRLVTTVCILLSACALSNAQKKDEDPLKRVVKELEAGRTEQAIAALDELIKQYPNNADAYYFRASLKMQADPAQALTDYDKVIELKPDSGPAYNQRAFLRMANNDTAGALKDLDAAIAHNFKDDSVYYLRGQLRWQMGELKPALSDLDEAIKLNPGNPRVYSSRGELLLVLQEVDRSLADFNYLIKWYETDPSARPAPKPKRESKSQLGPTPTSDSKAFVVEIVQETINLAPGAKEMAPTIANAYVNRGLILTNRENHVAALSDFDKAIRIDPANMWAFYHRANEYEYKGDLPTALADIDKAIQIDSKNDNLLVERGVILLLMGRDKDAQADFDRLLQVDRELWQKRIDERIAAVRKLLPIK